MPRPIHTPAPKPVATPDLRPFDRTEMADEIRRSLCGYPRVVLYFVQDREKFGDSRTVFYTGRELAAILPHLPLTALTSAVAYDADGDPVARVSPLFKKAYAFEGKVLPVYMSLCIHRGKYSLTASGVGERPAFWARVNLAWMFSPRWFGFGYAGLESRATSH